MECNFVSKSLFVVSTDCEALLKKFLALNPAKRYTLEQIMKDKWMNMNEEELKPYIEPLVELNDKKVIDQLMLLGYKLNDVDNSLTKRKFDEIYSAYLLLSNNTRNKLSRSKPESMTSIASSSASALPISSPTKTSSAIPKSETITNGDGLKETSFMTSKLEENLLTASINRHPDPPSPELTSNNFKRQHTIGPESLKDRNALRLHTNVSGARPISATPKVNTERGLQKSPVKPLRAFKPEASLSTTAQTPRRPANNINVYKKVEPTQKDATNIVTRLNQAAGANTSGSSSAAFQRNGPSRYTFHSGQSRLQPRDHATLDSKNDPPSFGKGNFLQRLTTRFSKRFRLSQTKAVAEGAANPTKN